MPHGRSGFLRRVGDVDGMSEAVLELLRNDGLWRSFSAEARRRAEREFPTDALVERYRALYEATLAS